LEHNLTVPSTASSSSSLDDSSLAGMLDDVTLAKEIGAAAGAAAGAPNPGGGANGLTVLEGYEVKFRSKSHSKSKWSPLTLVKLS
jgi:hypothetical protein